MTKSRVNLNRETAVFMNDVCWVLVSGFPWWPARVVNRTEHEKTLQLDDGDYLAPPSNSNMMVVFFDEQGLTGVAERNDVVEYTSNMHLVRQSGRIRSDIVQACRDANEFIMNNETGKPEQRKRLIDLGNFEDFIKPAPRRRSKPAPTSHVKSTSNANVNANDNAAPTAATTTTPSRPPPAPEEERETKRRKSMRRNSDKEHVANAVENMDVVPQNNAKHVESPLGIVQDLLKGSEFVSMGLADEKPKINELQTVNRLITIGLRKLQMSTQKSNANCIENQGDTNSNPDSMANVVEDVLRGSELVDSGLRSQSVNVSHLRMLTRLVSVGLQTLRDDKFNLKL